jgi:hypothetical protein
MAAHLLRVFMRCADQSAMQMNHGVPRIASLEIASLEIASLEIASLEITRLAAVIPSCASQ